MTRREFLGAIGGPATLGAVTAALDPLGVRAALAMAADYAKSPVERPRLFRGLRVTPSVYTTLAEIDQFSEVMMEIAEKGIPA